MDRMIHVESVNAVVKNGVLELEIRCDARERDAVAERVRRLCDDVVADTYRLADSINDPTCNRVDSFFEEIEVRTEEVVKTRRLTTRKVRRRRH